MRKSLFPLRLSVGFYHVVHDPSYKDHTRILALSTLAIEHHPYIFNTAAFVRESSVQSRRMPLTSPRDILPHLL